MSARVAAVLLLGLLAGPAAAQPDGSYQATCRNVQFRDGVLQADCRTGDQTWRHSAIKTAACLGQKFENNNGTLICDRTGAAPNANRPAGTYLASCRNISQDGALLQARCKDRQGNWHVSTIDARSCGGDIGNEDGQLTCKAR